jgi:hypothetical protein
MSEHLHHLSVAGAKLIYILLFKCDTADLSAVLIWR